jgi:phage terminase large subunit-like protein
MALAQGTRVDPLMICPTTAGVRTDVAGRDSIAYTLYEYGKRIATGELRDPTFFFAWWEPPDGAGPVTDRTAWLSANPGLGDILSEADLASAAASVPKSHARGRVPDQAPQSVGQQRHRLAALGRLRGPRRGPPVGARRAGRAGLRWLVQPRLHGPGGLHPLDGFLEVLGLWERPPGAAAWEVPIEEVTQRVLAACRDYRVLEIAADPYRWAREIQAWAAAGLPAAEFPTSSPARMVPACATFYDAVVNGVLTHSGHPALVRHVGNAVVKVDRLGPRIVNEHRGSPRHIDLAVAAVAAYARAIYYTTESFFQRFIRGDA